MDNVTLRVYVRKLVLADRLSCSNVFSLRTCVRTYVRAVRTYVPTCVSWLIAHVRTYG